MNRRLSVIELTSSVLLLIILWVTIPVTYGYIRITSPQTGQHLPLGNITVSGSSASDATHHCIVSVVLNGIQPYKNATARGQQEGGANGYSNWTFTSQLTNPGLNKITAKFSCPHLTRFYSINVTAVDNSKSREKELQTMTNSATTSPGVPDFFPSLRNVKSLAYL